MHYECISFLNLRFENDVKEYGIQAKLSYISQGTMFENDVKSMVFKLNHVAYDHLVSLRMM